MIHRRIGRKASPPRRRRRYKSTKKLTKASPCPPCSPLVLKKLAELKTAIRFVRHDLEDARYIRATHSIEGVQLRFNELEELISKATNV